MPNDAIVRAVAARPQVVPQQDHISRTGTIVLLREITAKDGPRAEQRKQVPRYAGADIPFRFAAAIRDRQAAAGDCGNRREDRIRLVPVAHIEIRQPRLVVGVEILFADNENALRVGVGVRLQQNAVDHAENRGVQADAKAEAQDGDRRESLAARQIAEGVANVLEEHGGLYECTEITGSDTEITGFTTKKRRKRRRTKVFFVLSSFPSFPSFPSFLRCELRYLLRCSHTLS